jgi:hypothetical protein
MTARDDDAVSRPRLFHEPDLLELLEGDWSALGPWHERRDSGIWLIEPSEQERSILSDHLTLRLAHPTGNRSEPALPFPFTSDQFLAYCNASGPSHVRDWKGANDDDIAELKLRSRPAATLALLLRDGPAVLHGGLSATVGKLTALQKASIQSRIQKGEKVAALAREFNVSRRTIDKCKPPQPTSLAQVWTAPKQKRRT